MGEAFNVNEETIEMGYVNRDKGDIKCTFISRKRIDYNRVNRDPCRDRKID